MTEQPPKIENTPGLHWRRTSTGKWEGRWRARQDLIKKGFRPRLIRLFLGIWPSEDDEQYLRSRCQDLQDDMLIWSAGGLPQVVVFDGTVRALVYSYQNDGDSTFGKLRYRTREGYIYRCDKIIKSTIEIDGAEIMFGDMLIRDIRTRHILRLHEAWSSGDRVAMGHSMMTMLRTLVSFGASILEDEHCMRLSGALRTLRIKNAKPREERLTAAQVVAIRSEARRRGLSSIALAQAFQFDFMLRQKDVIGEWVPITEPGLSAVTSGNAKWLRGVRWDEIDQNMKLRHVTSKRQKEIVVDLRQAPMVMEELALIYGEGFTRESLPASGPVILAETTGMPLRTSFYQENWRKIATAVGVPKTVRNMDSRAGAITEATEAGAALESIRHAATHSDIGMTQRYARGAEDKTAEVMRLRAAHRNKKQTES